MAQARRGYRARTIQAEVFELILHPKEAEALADVLANIDGSLTSSRRRLTDSISKALMDAGVQRNYLSRNYLSCEDLSGTIRFETTFTGNDPLSFGHDEVERTWP